MASGIPPPPPAAAASQAAYAASNHSRLHHYPNAAFLAEYRARLEKTIQEHATCNAVAAQQERYISAGRVLQLVEQGLEDAELEDGKKVAKILEGVLQRGDKGYQEARQKILDDLSARGSFNEALLLEMNRRDDISAGGSSPSSAPGPGWGSFTIGIITQAAEMTDSVGGSSPSSSSTCRVKGTGKKICLPVMKEKRKKDKDDWGP